MLNRQAWEIFDIVKSKEKIKLSSLSPSEQTETIKKKYGLSHGGTKKNKKKRRKK